MEKLAYTLRETAQVLSIGERSVRRRINDGTIPSVRIGGRILVPVAGLRRVIEGDAAQ